MSRDCEDMALLASSLGLAPPPPMRYEKSRKRLCMRSVMEAVEALRLPVITSNQAAALAREMNRKLGL